MKRLNLLIVLLISTATLTFAQDESSGKISGYMFGDFYWVAANHRSDIENMNGFWLRRIYFTYDQILSDDFSIRVRFEMNAAGDFSSSSKLEPFIKDAYLKWKSGKTQIFLGISPTPTWDVIEKTWGYRSIEKTPLDLQKFGSSRDFGVAIKGPLSQNGKVKYHLMFANGNSNKSETNKGKKILLSLGFYPTKKVMVEIYGDWNDQPGKNDWFTIQGFMAYKTPRARFGIQLAHQTRKVAGGKDLKLEIGSIFIATKMNEKTNFFLRADRTFDPNPQGNKIAYIPFDPTTKSTFLVGGLDFIPIKTVHFMPNAEVVFYDNVKGSIQPDTDLIPRLTFYYKF